MQQRINCVRISPQVRGDFLNNKVTFEETVELFVNNTIYEIISEFEVPRINIVFKKEAYNLFYRLMESPFKEEGYWTPNIEQKDIRKLKEFSNGDYPTIYVNDHVIFFEYLTEITNNLIILYEKYGEQKSARALLIQIMRRIWLRMGVNDFNDVEKFLYRELQFIKNDLFDDYRLETEITHFYNYDVKCQSIMNRTWDESNRSIKFKIYNEYGYHSLPHIMYDIVDYTCYIYAVQNDYNKKRIPKIERLLYKLNKGVENPNVHPSQVYSMKLFIEMLKEKGINNIKIPVLQVLSYRYHELLSTNEKEKFSKKWDKDTLGELSNLSGNRLEYKKKEYETDKKWYSHVVDKEDTISKLKTENLINLVYRVVEEDDSLKLLNDIDIDDTLNIKINNKIKKKI